MEFALTAYRFIPVVALLGLAAFLLTDRSKPPLALRGLKKMLGSAGSPAGGGGLVDARSSLEASPGVCAVSPRLSSRRFVRSRRGSVVY